MGWRPGATCRCGPGAAVGRRQHHCRGPEVQAGRGPASSDPARRADSEDPASLKSRLTLRDKFTGWRPALRRRLGDGLAGLCQR